MRAQGSTGQRSAVLAGGLPKLVSKGTPSDPLGTCLRLSLVCDLLLRDFHGSWSARRLFLQRAGFAECLIYPWEHGETRLFTEGPEARGGLVDRVSAYAVGDFRIVAKTETMGLREGRKPGGAEGSIARPARRYSTNLPARCPVCTWGQDSIAS